MAKVLAFHHVLGVTPGIRSFAERLQREGHDVVVPDLFDGVTFGSIDEGVSHAESIGFDVLIDRGVAFADGLGDGLVVSGFSLGVLPAQKLAQTRPGVVGAILFHSAVPPEMFGRHWPETVALQLHLTEHDPWAEEDIEAARTLAQQANGELYLYPGSRHLVADSSSPDHDPEVAELMLGRTLAFLESLDRVT